MEAGSPKKRKWKQNLLVFGISMTIALVIGELLMRWMIFSGGDGFKGIRRPGFYASMSEDAYWKLDYIFGNRELAPEHPHPLLGWIGAFDPHSYIHRDFGKMGKRRPVLLYGDSFAQCVSQSECFETILNSDSAFMGGNYLLNYGVGGYGLGQAGLLCDTTVKHYQHPFVVFSMLTEDIDRTILSFRTGQKPYWDVVDGELKCKGYPILESHEKFIETHPPEITSYLWRRFLYSDLNILPYRFTSSLKGKYHWIEKKKEVNALLIKQIVANLRAAKIEFTFLIFHFEDDMMSPESENNWRDQFFREVLAENDIPYIWSKDIIREHRLQHPDNLHDAYIIPGNGHPTTLYNELIAAEIKRLLLGRPSPVPAPGDSLNEAYYDVMVSNEEAQIRQDSIWLKAIAAKAMEEGRTLDEQIHLDAIYTLNQNIRERSQSPAP